MSQAYPQFTPVQILEAGQRAFAEGRTEYATQFFKHLIDHYSDTPEAAVAREALAQAHGTSTQPASPHYPQPPANGNGHHAPSSGRPSAGYASSAAANGSLQGIQLSVDGQPANGRAAPERPANGHAAATSNGRAHAYGAEQHAYQAPLQPGEPVHGRVQRGPEHPSQRPQGQARSPRHAEAAMPVALAPAPQKSYIIGRVVAGLLLLFGILGVFGGIVLVYAAITDPGIFAGFGLATPVQALTFSGAVLVGSILALILAQAATALFDGADAVADLARLERYRVGDGDDDED